jgi:hypothetical protein
VAPGSVGLLPVPDHRPDESEPIHGHPRAGHQKVGVVAGPLLRCLRSTRSSEVARHVALRLWLPRAVEELLGRSVLD